MQNRNNLVVPAFGMSYGEELSSPVWILVVHTGEDNLELVFAIAKNSEEAVSVASEIGTPLLCVRLYSELNKLANILKAESIIK